MSARAFILPRIAVAGVLAIAAPLAHAQDAFGPPAPGSPAAVALASERLPADLAPLLSGSAGSLNPLQVIAGASRALPGNSPANSDAGGIPGLTTPVSILLLLTVLALVPSLILMTTCFVRVLIVLGLLKQAIGAQSVPPPQVVTALAMFMTMLVMAPTYNRVYTEAIVPYQAGQIRDLDSLWVATRQPVRDFMFDQIEATGNWSSLYMVLNYRGFDVSAPERLTRADVDMVSLIPAFMLSELKTAFLMGFRVYLPFLVIDMVISALLISMSMMMLPPVLISLPFKILLFVMVDGWQLVVGGLLTSFVQPGELGTFQAQVLPALPAVSDAPHSLVHALAPLARSPLALMFRI